MIISSFISDKIDTRIKFDMGETEYTPNTCILVLDIDMNGETVHVGALVDSVQEVIEIDDANIQPPPSIGSKYKSEFIEGMAKINEDFIMLLNMDLIFSSSFVILILSVFFISFNSVIFFLIILKSICCDL